MTRSACIHHAPLTNAVIAATVIWNESLYGFRTFYFI